MTELDMTGVDPLRWAETRRRVDAVKDYIAIPSPTDEDKRVHAGRLDLSVNQFLALVRAWRRYGEARRIAGSGAHRRSSRRPSRLSVPEASKQMAGRIIDEMGPTARFVDVHKAVIAQAACLSLESPSRSTLWNMVMRKRQVRDAEGDAHIVVGRCHVRLPVNTRHGIAFPEMLLAVRSSDGVVLAATPHAARVDAILDRLEGVGLPIRIDRSIERSIKGRAPESVGKVGSVTARTALSMILGRGIADLELIHVVSSAVEPERLLTTKEDRTLDLQDADRIIFESIVRHNAARGAAPPIWVQDTV